MSRSKHTQRLISIGVLLQLLISLAGKCISGENLWNSVGARSRLIMHRRVPFSLNIAWRSWRISYDGVMGKYCYWIIMEWRVGK